MEHILLLGYYNHKNLGDDVFEYIFTKLFELYGVNYTIMDMDKCKTIPPETTKIIFGGGDLINDYFMKKLWSLNTPKKCPTYAVGIGIPYPGLIDRGYLDHFDMTIHRNKVDVEVLNKKYGEERVRHFPDLSLLLPKIGKNKLTSEYLPDTNKNTNKKRIGVFLSRTIYSSKDTQKYETIISNLALFFYRVAKITAPEPSLFIKTLTQCGRLQKKSQPLYEIIFMPCSTDPSENQNDNIINKHIYDKILAIGHCENIKIITDPVPIEEIIPIFKSFYMTIATRFHANVFSSMCNVPMLSVYSSRKVDNLLEELELKQYSYKMQVDSTYLYPLEVDNDVLMDKFKLIIKDHIFIQNRLRVHNHLNNTKLNELLILLNNMIFYPIRNYSEDEIGTIAMDKSIEIAKIIAKIQKKKKLNNKIENDNKRYRKISKQTHLTNISTKAGQLAKLIVRPNVVRPNVRPPVRPPVPSIVRPPIVPPGQTICRPGQGHGNRDISYDDYDEIKITPELLAQIMSFVLIGKKQTDYNYGIISQIANDDFILFESCKWILKDYFSKDNGKYSLLTNTIPIKKRCFNMPSSRQHDLKGYHRSGWEFVTHNLLQLHNPNDNVPIFDSYLDKTFGWEFDFLTTIGYLPYKKSWVGVFHHTPDPQYSDNNIEVCFNNIADSLATCKAIIVFSDYLQEWVRKRLFEILPDNSIKVLSFYHPSQEVDDCLKFDYTKYLCNSNKKIIQIGAWLRNSYSIYELQVPKKFKKCALKGKAMDNYFINDKDLIKIEHALFCPFSHSNNCNNITSTGHSENCDGHVSRPFPNSTTTNKYIVGLMDMIRRNHATVDIIDKLNNEDYDILLSKNIVYINLVNASAVNTIIECIIRDTPILVNRLPATEQYLGKDYPLLYETIEHAQELLRDNKSILNAYKYLKKMDKSHLTINFFIDIISSFDYK